MYLLYNLFLDSDGFSCILGKQMQVKELRFAFSVIVALIAIALLPRQQTITTGLDRLGGNTVCVTRVFQGQFPCTS